MAEATDSIAARTRALQVALNLTKARLRAQGYRVSQFSHAELRAFAEAYLADHREELVAEPSLVVERWREEGFFGKHAKQAALRERSPQRPKV